MDERLKKQTAMVKGLVKTVQDYTDDPEKWDKSVISLTICVNPETGDLYTIAAMPRDMVRTVLAIALAAETTGKAEMVAHVDSTSGEVVDGVRPPPIGFTAPGTTGEGKPS